MAGSALQAASQAGRRSRQWACFIQKPRSSRHSSTPRLAQPGVDLVVIGIDYDKRRAAIGAVLPGLDLGEQPAHAVNERWIVAMVKRSTTGSAQVVLLHLAMHSLCSARRYP